MLTLPSLRAAAPAASSVACATYAEPLCTATKEFGIDTNARLAAFLAQILHESGNLRYVVENLNYDAQRLRAVFGRYFTSDEAARYAHKPEAIANRVYAHRLGNGNEASGDGWRYRGRGLIQITGRANYDACGRGLGLDLLAEPALLEHPIQAARSAAWFWHSRNLNKLADARDIEAITRRINGGLNGLADRRAQYACAVQAFAVP